MEPRFAAITPQPDPTAPPSRSFSRASTAEASAGTSADRPKTPRLLALSVHWDDCSVAIGTRDAMATEVWSGQPERASADASDAAALPASGGSPVASRDALLLLDRLLVRTDTSLSAVDRLCFARGPGAFTSLRVAAGLIQGLSLATSIPVAGICSLAALAAHEPRWREDGSTGSWLQLSAIDARMGECYFAVHLCQSGRHPTPVTPPAVGPPARAIAAFENVCAQQPARDVVLAGNAFRLLPELAGWARRTGHDADTAGARAPTAAAVLAVAASPGAPAPGPAHTALPVYVRDKIALDVNEQRVSAAARALADAGAGAGEVGSGAAEAGA